MDIGQVHIAIKAIDFWALFACIGLLIARVGLLPPVAFGIEGVTPRWHRLLGLMLALLTATGLALLLVRVMAMSSSSPAETLRILPSVLLQTHFGRIWALHLLSLLLLWIGWVISWRTPGRGAASFMLTAVALTAFTYSASSHAADSGDFTLAELNDWLHVLFASLWGGGVLASAIFIFPIFRKRPGQSRALIGEMVSRLSSLSALALALVLVTGIYNAAIRLGSFNELMDSSYGHILGIKLILVTAMAIIGLANRFILVPKIRQWAAKSKVADNRCSRSLLPSE
jgi:copper resistance protein D